MTHHKLLAGAAAFLIGATGVAQAQVGVETRPPLSPVQAGIGTGIDREVEDIEIRTQRELAQSEDAARFGIAAAPPGFAGSVSLTGVATWGNTDTVDVGLAGSFTLGQGRLNHSFGVAVEYGESDGDRDRNRLLGIYDLNFDVTEQFYVFGLVRSQYDEFAAVNEWDVFAGVGPGIRLARTENFAWRVQAGPGVRFTREIGTGDEETELAGIASSRAFFRISDDMFISNDTDVLHSDVDTLVSNDLALNTRLAGPLSARVGLRTDYSTDPLPGNRSTDNRLTLGVVYSFQ